LGHHPALSLSEPFRLARRRFAGAAAVLLLLCFVRPAVAANKYWVGASTTTNAPTSGIWQTTTPIVWSDGGISGANTAWADGDAAFFGGVNGDYGIKVAGAINAASLRFSASGYTLTNDTPQTIATSSSLFLLVDAGKTNSIGTNVTVATSLAATASVGAANGTSGGTLNIENGGVVQQTANRPINFSGAGTVVSVKTGGILRNASAASGSPVLTVGGASGDNVNLIVDGGTVSVARNTASIWVPAGPTAVAGDIRGTLTLNSGAVTTAGGFVSLANGSGNSGTFNLNGGALSTSQVIGGAGTSVFNFNGGVLKALSSQTNFLTGLTTINVRNGGALIDCNGNNLAVGQPLLHSAIPGDAATDGGLTKLGTGTLMLNGPNTYNGLTTVSEGVLALGGSLRGTVVVSPGGALSGGPVLGPMAISNSLTLVGKLVLRVDKSAGVSNDLVVGVTTLNFGGSLELNLSAGSLAAGDVLTLFQAANYTGAFAKITANPALPIGLKFDTAGLLTNGSLRVVVNSNAVPLLSLQRVSAGLQLSWPTLPLYQYQLKTTAELTNRLTNWNDFGPVILGNGGSLSQVVTSNLPKQFFSLLTMPLPIDSSRLPVEPWKDTQWIDPGGWTTIDVTSQGLPANNTNIDAAVQIASIINNTSGRRRLYFPTGVYSFKSSLALNNRSDLWFDGEGRSNTVLRIDAPASANAEISFRGGTSGSPIPVLGSLVAGDAAITVADASTLNVGDLIQVYADNAPLAQGGLAFVTQVYGQMCRIVAKSGNTLTLDMRLLLDYPASYLPSVQRYNQIKNIKVSNLLVSRVAEPTSQDVSNLEFINAYNCNVVRVESSFAQRHHIYFQNAKDCVMESNYVHDCFVQTTGGYGYGFGLVGSTGCRISHNKSTRLRHHIILQIGANHNVVSYNSIETCYDYNDLALHAAYSYLNLFEGNMFTESYADTSKDGSTTVEPATGPENTWFRNFATGKVGSIQSATTRQNIIGNNLGTIVSSGADHYIGANNVAGVNNSFGTPWPGGTVNWGVLPANVILPASLYLTNRPVFFGNGVPWPVFGPGVTNLGVTNAIPARGGIPCDL
jgi:autotransporter-associated beta strand protein